ncbi:sucrose-6-phosphate hydrolase-like isoform X1 [Dysidea avara]|uniref:sucrose-6-phosphate hydrolase-like isoform X1 n=2 Tax=Dysidea avara TaxID=196820 RepID=UPI00332E07F5
MNKCFGCCIWLTLMYSTICNSAQFNWKPGFHITPERGWLNDPHPAFSRDPKGLYHVFYQCNPNSTLPPWAPGQQDHWCHDSSEDLASWSRNPPPGIPDGSSSGSVIQLNYNGSGVAVYGMSKGVGLSISMDKDLMTWNTSSPAPIITTPNSINASYVGDPHIWQEEPSGDYMVLVGSAQGDPTKTGSIPQALLFNSSNLINWEYVSTVWIGNSTLGPRAECVDMFPITDQLYVYIYSSPNLGKSLWFVGKMGAGYKFQTVSKGMVDYGHFYAANSFFDPHGRRIVYGWISESLSDDTIHKNGWAGMQSVPRVISLSRDNTLLFNPVEELSLLHGDHLGYFNQIPLPENATYKLGGMGNQLHMVVTIMGKFSPNSKVGILVLADDNMKEYTAINIQNSDTNCNHIGQWSVGTNIPGADYTNFKVDGHDPALCQKACCADSGCVAWTFADPQPLLTDYGNNSAFTCVSHETCCWLKNAHSSPVPRVNCTSGTTSTQLQLEVSTTNSSLLPATNVTKSSYTAQVNSHDQLVTLEIMVDKSAVEVFVNKGEAVITSRVYPTLASSNSVVLFTENTSAIFTVDAWVMKDAYKET